MFSRNWVGAVIIFIAADLLGCLQAIRSLTRFLARQDGITVSRLTGKPVELKWAHIRGVTIGSGSYEVAYVDALATLSFADPTEQARSESFIIPKSMNGSRELLAHIDWGLKTLPKSPLNPQQLRDLEQELRGR